MVVYLPMGMLELVSPVEYPLSGRPNSWLATLDAALLGLAERVYRAAPFELALIGEEALSMGAAARDLAAGQRVSGGMLLSPTLFHALRPATASVPLATGLRWFPPQA